MRTVAEQIDQLTHTFSTDRAYCDILFESPNASLVAELLLSHLWANTALPMCYQALSEVVPKHFGSRKDMAALWNLILCDGVNRDLRLMPYLVLRGLGSEASGALRRVFEHLGVLTQIWSFPEKVDALEDSRSRQYVEAFRRETSRTKQDALRKAKTSKRFEVMRSGTAATMLYDNLSEFDVHGGTNRRFFAYSTETNQLSCSFCERLDPNGGDIGRRLSILVNGHRLMCGELMCLCADHAARSEDLMSAAEVFRTLFGCMTGEPNPELQSRVMELLDKLRDPKSKTME